MKTNRRWLKSAIAAASSQEVMLPWAKKRIAAKPSNVVRLQRVVKPARTAIAAA